ncbi:MAG TPA: DUF3106 domain-containing protein [Acidobacteriaceae bacterium]|nr:DUF3106 domain-containing protein [Acidobacteriaceae bacterium]
MKERVRTFSGSGSWRLARTGLFAFLLAATAVCWGQRQERGGQRSGGYAAPQTGNQYRPQVRNQYRPQNQNQYRPQAQSPYRPGVGPQTQPMRPGPAMNPAARNQQHLPAWWEAHRGLSPQQQADALRRQQGFRNLPPQQQQRLINRLQRFDRQPQVQQQRTLNRMEAFEHLSPERRQEVRGASQAFSRMPLQRQQVMRRAFQQLRQMPPGERDRMLSSDYGRQFSPQERTVLGNLLSIEPYQPHIAQPYFGR